MAAKKDTHEHDVNNKKPADPNQEQQKAKPAAEHPAPAIYPEGPEPPK